MADSINTVALSEICHHEISEENCCVVVSVSVVLELEEEEKNLRYSSIALKLVH
jgi:hypothetical protein